MSGNTTATPVLEQSISMAKDQNVIPLVWVKKLEHMSLKPSGCASSDICWRFCLLMVDPDSHRTSPPKKECSISTTCHVLLQLSSPTS